MINIDALNDEEKLAALESIHKSIAESKEIQRKKITTNVEMIVKALKKIEADLKQRYDETGQLIANLKNGEDGRDGKDGKDGKNGKDGRDGPMGPRGYDGVPGRNGLDGADGVSVTDAHIDFDGSLIIHLSSGRVINVGEVVAADIAEKIKVITNGGGTSQSVLDAIASLQAQIDAIASGLEYQGTWNASTNTPTLASSVGTAGYYYIVATAGSTNLNGITDWQIGDWAVFNGTIWQKIDQSNLVTSVAGRTGAIVLTTADIGGLGTIATQAANNVTITGGSITGITDLAIADGGTGASTANAAFNALAPSQASNSGKYLTTNGTDTSWAAFSGGTVTSVSGTGTVNGLTLTGTVTTSGSLTLGGTLSGIANSALTNSSITINGSSTSLGGSINVGTVTSVAATVPSFLSIAGSPITSSGTLAITLSGTALPTTSGGTGLTSFTTNGVVYASSTSALATGSALTFDGSKLVNTGYNISAYQVSTGAVSTFESVGGGYLTYDGAGGASVYSRLNATTENNLTFRASGFSFRIGGTQVASLTSSNFSLSNASLLFAGATSGYTGFAAPAVSNFTVYTLPSSDGTTGQSLTTNGSGTLSWASTATGTVTSVGGTGTVSGLTLTGTVTSSGNLTLGGALDLSAYNGAGAFTTLSASSTVTLSGGTANGVAYLNGSKVVTSGSALTFDGTTLTSGAASFTTSLTAKTLTSSAGAAFMVPWIGDTSAGGSGSFYTTTGLTFNPSTGVFSVPNMVNSASALTFGVAASEQMRLTSTGLGIGTSSPAARLGVYAGAMTNQIVVGLNTTDTLYGSISFNGDNSSGRLGLTGGGGSDKNLYVDVPSGGAHHFRNAASVKMNLDSSGNLGLGVTPSAWYTSFGTKAFQFAASGSLQGLDVSSGDRRVALANNDFINSSGNNIYINTGHATKYQQATGQHQWFNAPSGTAGNAITFTQAMTLDASGNLLVGATSVAGSERLNIVGGTGIRVNEDAIGTKILTLRSDYAGLGPAINVTTSHPLLFLTANTERARIDSSGNLLVGTTSTSNGALINWYKASGTIETSLGGVTTAQNHIVFANPNGNVGSIQVDGSATSYNTSSDYRLKNITGPITSSGAYIDSLNPVEGTWKADGSTFVGLIAHEVQEASRTTVATGIKDGAEMQGMDYSSAEIIANLIAEVKSLRVRVAQLESN